MHPTRGRSAKKSNSGYGYGKSLSRTEEVDQKDAVAAGRLGTIGMCRGNMERTDVQNRSRQDGNNPRLGIPLQVLPHPLTGTRHYSSGV